MNPGGKDRWSGADFALFTREGVKYALEGDVVTYCTWPYCERVTKLMRWPEALEDTIHKTLPKNTRAMVGNSGCEVTFRHVSRGSAKKNIKYMLRWATRAYRLVGSRLVLAPMDVDLAQDVWTGGNLLRWAAAFKVPLMIFCGYRLLFQGDEFKHLRWVSKKYDFPSMGNPYEYPFDAVGEAVRNSGAEVWTGVGYDGGLANESVEKAEQFGFRGVLTTRSAWEKQYDNTKPSGKAT